MDDAIETATSNLKKKLEKAHAKHKHPTNDGDVDSVKPSLKVDIKNCTLCQQKEEDLESGRKSPIINSPTTSAKLQRRRGVSERNSTESQLVREALKIVFVNENIDTWGLTTVPYENK